MRTRDAFDAACGVAAMAADASAVLGGFLLAEWMRHDSGWFRVINPPPDNRAPYIYGSFVATALLLAIFRALRLYARPQIGTFSEKIPRLVRAVGTGLLLTTALAFAVRVPGYPEFSRGVVLIAFVNVLVLVLVERAILFRLEIRLARRQRAHDQVVILGTDATAARLKASLEAEPRLRTRLAGFLRLPGTPADAPVAVPAGLILGDLDDLEGLITRGEASSVILADSSIGRERIVQILLECERELVPFQMVPDLYGILTCGVEVSAVDGVPLMGVRRWPLDFFWNRAIKRVEDVVLAAFGLLVSLPLFAVAAVLIRRESPGPVFYRQVRCGVKGRPFTIYKLRTMRVDAEAETGPVWTSENDPRRTRVGAFLRTWNIDELPQFWNVLKGDMSLVGPRPERPEFVEKFREDVGRYMLRHASRPGITGWAQVNGLRGNTDIRERVSYDLYYLENWSLALDFKILARTFFARKNAY